MRSATLSNFISFPKINSQMMCQLWMRSTILENVSSYRMVTHHLETTFGEIFVEK
jgi:hypothetical protein